MSTLWYWYCVFFHFNPAGFIFLHSMAGVALAAMVHEWRWQYKHRNDPVVLKRIEYKD